MKKYIITLIIFLSVFLPTQNASAFDGNRKGFILGIGGGLSKLYFTNETKNAYVLNTPIGYGINDQNTLLWNGTHNMYKIDNRKIGFGYSEFSWNHYFTKKDNSFFSTIGVTKFVMWNIYWGGGYTISKNFQIGIFYRELFDNEFLDDLKISITYVAF